MYRAWLLAVWVALPIHLIAQSWGGTFFEYKTGEILTVKFEGDVAKEVQYSNGTSPFKILIIEKSFMKQCEYAFGDTQDSLPAVWIKFSPHSKTYELSLHHYEWYGLISRIAGNEDEEYQTFIWCGPQIIASANIEQALANRLEGTYLSGKEFLRLKNTEKGAVWYYKASEAKADSIELETISFLPISKEWIVRFPNSTSTYKLRDLGVVIGPNEIQCFNPDGTEQTFTHHEGYFGPMYPIDRTRDR